MKRLLFPVFLMFLLGLRCTSPSGNRDGAKFSISFTRELSDQAQDGRLIILLATNDKSEPRHQFNFGLKTQPAFAIDVEKMIPGQEIIIDATAFGFPIGSLREVAAGVYFIKTLIISYDRFHFTTR